MKFIIITCLSLIMICPIFPQNLERISLTSNKEWNSKFGLKDIPVQLGFEFGVPLKIMGKNFFTSGFFGYLNINLSQKILFLKIEYGNLWLNKELEENTAPYAAISVTAQMINVSKTSKVYIDFGYGFFSNNNYMGGGVKIGLSYIQRFNKLISMFASLKIPVIRESRDEFHFNPYFTVGLQFF